MATLFRLGLNIAVTRLILLHGYAGSVIESFGHFVIGGSLIVGLVIFLILIVIQFVVVTNGAGRVAEVGARFTLDAMPGKQMAIDADLNAGIIDEDVARSRRKEVADEADFYGAMDGASKFVKGDAIAAIVIVIINLVGGFLTGVLQMGMSPADALNQFSLLTVGDGIVSQIPALLISMAAGLVVTRAATEADLGADLLGQLTAHNQALSIAGPAIAVLGLFPGLPKIPFLVVGGGLWILSRRLRKRGPRARRPRLHGAGARAALGAGAAGSSAAAPHRPDARDAQRGDAGRGAGGSNKPTTSSTSSTQETRAATCSTRCRACTGSPARLGFVIPTMRTRDNIDLPQSTYVVKLHGVEFGSGEAPPGHALAIGEDGEDRFCPGIRTREPVFGLPATWIPLELRAQADLANVTVVDRASVVTTHLSEIVRAHAADLLSREDVKALLDVVRTNSPVAADGVPRRQPALADGQRILQALLAEGVPIRDLVRISEVLSARATTTKDTEMLTEAVRSVLGPAISSGHAIDGVLPAITLAPVLEQELLGAVVLADGGGAALNVGPRQAHRAGRLRRPARAGGRATRPEPGAPVLGAGASRPAAHRRPCHPPTPRPLVRGARHPSAAREPGSGECRTRRRLRVRTSSPCSPRCVTPTGPTPASCPSTRSAPAAWAASSSASASRWCVEIDDDTAAAAMPAPAPAPTAAARRRAGDPRRRASSTSPPPSTTLRPLPSRPAPATTPAAEHRTRRAACRGLDHAAEFGRSWPRVGDGSASIPTPATPGLARSSRRRHAAAGRAGARAQLRPGAQPRRRHHRSRPSRRWRRPRGRHRRRRGPRRRGSVDPRDGHDVVDCGRRGDTTTPVPAVPEMIPAGPGRRTRAVVALGLPAAFVLRPRRCTTCGALTQRLSAYPPSRAAPRRRQSRWSARSTARSPTACASPPRLGIEDDGVVLATRNEPMSLSTASTCGA
ncbi:MAG: flagellar biosynthesis protein FlhA [Acidimicrobiia bacterium]